MGLRGTSRWALAALALTAAVFAIRQSGDEPLFVAVLATVLCAPVAAGLVAVRDTNRWLRRVLLVAAYALAVTWVLLARLPVEDCVDCGFAVLLAVQQTVVHLVLLLAAVVDRYTHRDRLGRG